VSSALRALSWLVMTTWGLAACSSPDKQAETTGKKMVGELERLGKDGRDWIVLGADAPGFDALTLSQKKLAYYLYRAAIAGDEIMYQQNHRHALEIKHLLEAIYLNRPGLPEDVQRAVHEYLKYIWINHGNYNAAQGTKFLPNTLTFEMLQQAAEHAQRKGAKLVVEGETLGQKLERLRPTIFDASFEPVLTEQGEGKDIVAASAVNFWDPGITSRDLEALGEPSNYWTSKINVRFARGADGRIVPQEYRLGGVFDRELRTIVYFLEKAAPLAESEFQRRGLQALIEYYRTGEEERFRQYSVEWLKSETVIDYLNGFVETYHDPRGVTANFEGNVSFVSDSALVGRLADGALYFEQKMPWPERYRRTTVNRPVANVVNVIVETGDSGPFSPVAYNLPNYTDLRRDVGSKNIILINIETARSEKIRDATLQEFYLPETRELARKYGDLGRLWEVYMHEVIGHGSGKPDEKLKQDPRHILGRAFSSLEECRADLVALYHIFDPKLAEIGAFKPEDQRDVALATYQGFLQGHLNGYRRYEDDTIREAHQRGRQLVLMYLHSGGETGREDYGVKVLDKEGDYFVQIQDLDKARAGVGALLSRLQVIKSTGDAQAAAELFARFGTKVDAAWRDNIRARAAKLALPNLTAFVFPRLIPVGGGKDGKEVVDVKIAFDEDLTAQQLRWSRLAGVADGWVY